MLFVFFPQRLFIFNYLTTYRIFLKNRPSFTFFMLMLPWTSLFFFFFKALVITLSNFLRDHIYIYIYLCFQKIFVSKSNGLIELLFIQMSLKNKLTIDESIA